MPAVKIKILVKQRLALVQKVSAKHRLVTANAIVVFTWTGVLNKYNKITIEEYNEKGKFHASTLTRRFGGWFSTTDRAGLERTRCLSISDEELFENLESVWEVLGRQPRYNDMTKPLSRFCAGTYENRYSSWRKALERFVQNMENVENNENFMIYSNENSISRHRTKRDANWRLRFLVMRRDNFKCVTCGRSPATDNNIVLYIDHIVAWNKGGETVFEIYKHYVPPATLEKAICNLKVC